MLEIQLLGEQRVTTNGAPLEELRSPRVLGLLAFLAVHAGAPQLRQHLAGVFWPDSGEGQARTNLRRELHRLRNALPDPDRFITVDSTSVCWRPEAPASVDVVTFQEAAATAEEALVAGDEVAFAEAAEAAVHAYGGELLPAFYDEWVLADRERLRRCCVELLDRLVDVRTDQGAPRQALSHARRRVGLEPLEEAGYRALMRLEALAGDRAAALRTFHRCVSVLEHELGMDPDPATMAVYEQLLASPAGPVPELVSVPDTAPLVGRDRELEVLREAWAQATNGLRLVVISGEAGVGKSRVAAELADALERGGGVVARARCFPAGGRLALAPVAEWLRSPPLRSAVEGLDADQRAEVARLAPELAPGDEQDRPAPLTDAWRRRRFFEALVSAVIVCDEPVLLVLDDLQWCDAETLAWLEVLLHADPAPPVLVVGTLRSEELQDNAALVTTCRRLRAQGALRDLELAPLGLEDVAELAASVDGASPDEATLERLRDETDGFPLFVIESLRHGPDRSSRVQAILLDRIEQLGPDAQELAGVAAAVGRDFSLELLAAAGQLDEERLLEAVDELWRRRLLREHSTTTYDFSHDLLRQAAYERLSPPSRQLLHRRIVDALTALHDDDPERVATQLADQCEQAGLAERAIDEHALAAQAATRVFALEAAVAHYERALELLADQSPSLLRDRRELQLRAALLPPLTGLKGYAASELDRTLDRTTELAGALGEAAIAVRSQVTRWGYLFVRGRVRESLALTERLLDHATDHPEQRGQIWTANASALTSAGRLHEAVERLERVARQADDDENFLYGFRVKAMGYGFLAHALWLTGRSAAAAQRAEAGIELAEASDHPFSEVVALAYGAITRYLLGEPERTLVLARQVRGLCDRNGFAYYGDWGRILEGTIAGGAAGEALVRQGMERLESHHAHTRMPFWLSLLADLLVDAGRTDEAGRVLADARRCSEREGDRWWLAELCRQEARLRDGDERRALLEQALAVAIEQGAAALELRAATDLSRHHVATGRGDEAVRLLEPVRSRVVEANRADLDAADEVLTAAC